VVKETVDVLDVVEREGAPRGAPAAEPAGRGAEAWDVLSGLVRDRRSNLRVDPDRAVPQEVVDRLLGLACWAPNHKHTHPWRFAVVTGAARARLGEAAAAGLPRLGLSDPAVLEKTRRKYLRAPVVVIAGAAADPLPHLHRENHDAVAAGVQNLLLGATALGLASFWSTGAPVDVPEVKRLAGLSPEDDIVAFVYLGWPLESAPRGWRAAPVVTYVDD